MSTCCDTSPDAPTATGTLTVALAGNPNCGKTTLFNALTGLRQKVANYPGVTVEKKTGRCRLNDGRWIDVIDLPGTYSLISRSPDEQVAMEVLRGLRPDTRAPDVVIVVVDASNLQRNLYLVSQLIELGRPLVVALNMVDVAERRGLAIAPETLERDLGVPVVPVVGHKGKGIKQLKEAIRRAKVAPTPQWPLPAAMQEELLLVGGGLAILDSHDAPATEQSRGSSEPEAPPQLTCYQALAERLLIGDRAGDLARLSEQAPVSSLLRSATTRLASLGIDPMQADIEAHYKWIDDVAGRATRITDAPAVRPADDKVLDYAGPARTFTDKLDAVLIHKVWGLAVFAVVMAVIFVSIFWVADPIMGAIESGVGAVGQWVARPLPDGGPLKALVTDGIFAGVGGVVVFVPQIAMLFFFLALLEDSGYLARAAFLMDRLLAKVGLHGKSFIPLLSSFACAIPGIMAARTIESRKDRLATIFVAPFMSCSARLPVYALLIGAFFAPYGALAKGGILLSLYGLGILAAVATAFLFKRTMLKGPQSAFILELPTYKLPQASQVARQVWNNTSKFLTKAGTIIFCLSILLWAMTYYPRMPGVDDGSRKEQLLINELWMQQRESAHAFAEAGARYPGLAKTEKFREDIEHSIAASKIFDDQSLPRSEKLDRLWKLTGPDVKETAEKKADEVVAGEQLRHSISGWLGHLIEPAIRPLGYDWKMGVGLVSAFAAREVFVSTMGIVYSVGDASDDATNLESAMLADRYPDGRPVWTPLVAVSLLVWFVLAMQCMSTLAIVRRETGTWRWPLFMLLYMNALAYVVSFAVFQLGRIWFA
jgi:ferrous iron transport protein B